MMYGSSRWIIFPPFSPVGYQIFRRESAPFLSVPAMNLVKFDDISTHFDTLDKTKTIPTHYKHTTLIHSNSAPSDIVWDTQRSPQRFTPRGFDDTERDGPISTLWALIRMSFLLGINIIIYHSNFNNNTSIVI